MDWTKRAIGHGSTVVARILTEHYIRSMKALGYDSVNVVSEGANPGKSNESVYCHSEYCIVDANETKFYMVHVNDCPLHVELV